MRYGYAARAGFFIMGLFSVAATAQELSWSLVSAKSKGNGVTCSNDTVQLIDAGTNLALVFTEMNADLAGGTKQRKFSEAGQCTVELKMTIPQGYFLTGGTSTIFGGVEKSKGAFGYVQSWAYLWGKAVGAPNGKNGAGLYSLIFGAQRSFPAKEEVSIPLFQLESTKQFKKAEQNILCNATKNSPFDARMIVHVNVGATRQNDRQSSIVSVDSSDTNFFLGMKTARCPG